jgi:sulfate permease, SulP family
MSSFKLSSLRWNRIFPFLGWWLLLGRETLRADFFAGITGAVIVLPRVLPLC